MIDLKLTVKPISYKKACLVIEFWALLFLWYNCVVNEFLCYLYIAAPYTTPTVSTTSDNKSNYVPFVYGIAAGVCLLIVLTIVIIVIVAYRRTKTRRLTQSVSYNKLINSWTIYCTHFAHETVALLLKHCIKLYINVIPYGLTMPYYVHKMCPCI